MSACETLFWYSGAATSFSTAGHLQKLSSDLPLLHVLKAGHIHKVGHFASLQSLRHKNCVKTKPFKQADLITRVKHGHFIPVQLFR